MNMYSIFYHVCIVSTLLYQLLDTNKYYMYIYVNIGSNAANLEANDVTDFSATWWITQVKPGSFLRSDPK